MEKRMICENTMMSRRFMNDSFTEATDRKSTMGLDHYGRTFHVADRDLKLQLWDTGGRQRTSLPIRVRYLLSNSASEQF
jgi:Ras-related protein Rab-6A